MSRETRPVDPTPSAADVLARARSGGAAWSRLPAENRARLIGRMREIILARRDEIVAVVAAETGKPEHEALLSDIFPTLEFLRYLELNAKPALADRAMPTPFYLTASTSRIVYRPRGVVLVIAPWNNPLQLALAPAAAALAAGNTVVLKPSERTPRTGAMIAELAGQAGLGAALLLAPAEREAGAALVDAGPDQVFFTGSAATGRRVAAAAAGRLIPAILELGGKDPALVFADADRERAGNGILYGAFAHAGQHCVSVKRLYVEREVYDDFTGELARALDRLAPDGADAELGRPLDEAAVAAAREQVAEAVAGGARVIRPAAAEDIARRPTLVLDAAQSSRLMKEETFAPVLAARPFVGEEEAVALANDSAYGLNASVWTGDAAKAERVIRNLETGNVYVNNVLTNVGNPHLPFGGVKSSGNGAYHGWEGIRAFARTLSVMVSSSEKKREPNWFPWAPARRALARDLVALRHGRRGPLARALAWLRLGWRIRKDQ